MRLIPFIPYGFFILFLTAYPLHSQESSPFQLDCPGPGCPAIDNLQGQLGGMFDHTPEPAPAIPLPPPSSPPIGNACATPSGIYPGPNNFFGSPCYTNGPWGTEPGFVIFLPPSWRWQP